MGPWTSYILWLLHTQGAQRFGALKNAMPGISAKVLTERLRMLEEAGLLVRDYKPTVPPEVSYSLSARGGDLQGVLNAVGDLAMKWQEEERQREVAPA
jgi:DNA-binding HxlR family transcriptional regulator